MTQQKRVRFKVCLTFDPETLRMANQICDETGIPFSRLTDRALLLMVKDGKNEAVKRMSSGAKSGKAIQ